MDIKGLRQKEILSFVLFSLVVHVATQDVNECIEIVTSCSNGGCITVDEKLRCPVYLVASNSIPLTKGAVIANIPILEKEYIVSFDVYLASFTTDVRIVVYFTIGLNRSNNDMIPALLLYPNGNMAIPAPANGNFFTYPNPIALNTWTNVRISQVLIGTQYVNSIRINENTVSDYANDQAQDFYNVTVYASDTWFEAQDGFIRNLFFINGKANNYECDVHPPCSWNNGVCTNSNGSYYCSCTTGWTLGQDGISCIDINECIQSNPPCSWSNGVCMNTNGSFLCSCNMGWTLGEDNASCVDVNECASSSPPCSLFNGVCNNTYGSYFCSCNKGWMLAQDNATCVDVNECIENVTSCSNGGCITVDKQPRCPVYLVGSISIPLTKGAVIASIPILEKEYIVSFDVFLTSFTTDILIAVYFTIGLNRLNNDMIPALLLYPNGNMAIPAPTNGNFFDIPNPIALNTWTNVRISQVLIGTQYVNTIRINENTVYDYVNDQAQDFYNVTVYASDTWFEAQDGFIKNMFFINGKANNYECDVHPPCSWNNGVCTNSNGSYYCSCATGWTLGQDDISCIDINECIQTNPPCSWSNAVCVNTNGSFFCSCKVGWTLGQNNASCVDVNECASSSPPCSLVNGVCNNTYGSYFCSCKKGWMLAQDNATCVDVNECIENVTSCSNGGCITVDKQPRCPVYLVGSMSIPLTKGAVIASIPILEKEYIVSFDVYFSSFTTNIRIVVYFTNGSNSSKNDVIPAFVLHVNGKKTFLVSTDGYFFDILNPIALNSWTNVRISQVLIGTQYVNTIRINENTVHVYVNHQARDFYNVTVYTSHALFEAQDGFLKNMFYVNGKANINECTQTNPPCFWSNGLCTNTNGSFFCSCNVGWALGQDNASCVDVDECSSNIRPCSWSNGVCLNTLGSFICSCKYRWILGEDSSSCIDICEGCEENKNKVCDIRSATKILCLCKNGYFSLDNMMTCIDVDDCSSETNGCRDNSICVNTDGGYNCTCPIGFILTNDGMGCQDVNECLQNKCGLDHNVTCINKVGNFECICPQGQFFNSSVLLCQDINECLFTGAEYPCDSVRGHCENQPFPVKYVCSCPTGWSLSSKNICTDVNECLIWCNGTNGRCINQVGGFQCMCAVGYAYSNVTHQCEQVNMCALGFQCPNNSVCTMTVPGSVSCQCINGLMMDYSSNCVEINNCNGPNMCYDKPHSRCVNKQGIGMWSCDCLNGYQAVGNFCSLILVNECIIAEQEKKSLCKLNQQCIDTTSSFKCRCLTGFSLTSTGDCEDINECIVNKTACQYNADCVNTYGSYYCKCKISFVAENVTDSSLMHCYAIESIWSSWEQISTCSELCSTDAKQGKIKFHRRCLAIDFNSCNGQFLKEEYCNSEYCDNKIRISKRLQCEKWSNMQPTISDISAQQNETWLKKLKSWNSWKVQGCHQSLDDASLLVNHDIKSIRNEIKRLSVYRSMLIDVIDCNTYIQRQAGLLKEYISVYSEITMYASIKAALSKLKSRIDLKLNNCARGMSLLGVYSSLSQVKNMI
ncbi:fibrillin-1 isoform X7 [Hydra vulgaris]|uniref:Fibrillin-1 isoform X7 n=1 Tax=Hydra vulgaris TaxID=6087 RepID=A0ABM4DE93_HYDVU